MRGSTLVATMTAATRTATQFLLHPICLRSLRGQRRVGGEGGEGGGEGGEGGEGAAAPVTG